MTEQYFFTCSIGPVQGFVATARTSQDLWFGSWMLSELAKAAAKALKDGGHTLIFPPPTSDSDLNPGSRVNVANKVIAIINHSPKSVGEQVWDAINARHKTLADDSFNAVPSRFDRAEAQKQLDDLVEFYWAAVPYDVDKGDDAYKQARSRAEALFNARKNTRTFQQMRGKDGLPKSSLDGFRESVLLDGGNIESLSGVDLLKRYGKRPAGEKFLSTTDVAAKSFEIYLGERCEPLRHDIEAIFLPIAERAETPGTLFYVDRLVQLIRTEEHAIKFREQFAEFFRKYNIDRQPSPYYALLQADGDNMGKTIDNQREKQAHSNLSMALSTFAAQATEIIRQHEGVPVYAGGDDMLAYLPLHTALACVKRLDTEFSQAMKDFESAEGNHPALSVGLAIAHHLTPLSDVLEQVRHAEKAAKKVKGKNGLAISLAKRGSAKRVVTDKLAELTERMEQLIDTTLQKAISHGAAYELENLERALSISEIETGTREDMLRKEATRVIGRKRESGGDEKMNRETKAKFERWLEAETLTLDELAREMIIAGELAKAYELAKEKKP